MEERQLTVRMDITDKCNLRCIMCYFRDGAGKEEMPPDVFDRIAGGLFPRAHTVFLACGAEALMSRQFIPYLERTRREGVPSIQLVTNGMLLTDRVIDALIANDVDVIEVSMDGARADTYEGIRVGAKFEKVLGNLRRLRDAKSERGAQRPGLRLRWVMMRRNMSELPLFLDIAHDVGAEAVGVQHLVLHDDFAASETIATKGLRKRSDQSIRLAVEKANAYGIDLAAPPYFYSNRPKMRELAHKMVHYSLRNKAREIWASYDGKGRYVQRCFEPWHTVYISHRGLVTPCPVWKDPPMGDFEHQSFDEIWNGMKYRALREELETGSLRNKCQACPIYYGDTPWR